MGAQSTRVSQQTCLIACFASPRSSRKFTTGFISLSTPKGRACKTEKGVSLVCDDAPAREAASFLSANGIESSDKQHCCIQVQDFVASQVRSGNGLGKAGPRLSQRSCQAAVACSMFHKQQRYDKPHFSNCSVCDHASRRFTEIHWLGKSWIEDVIGEHDKT